jgi:predicted outer membrane protein
MKVARRVSLCVLLLTPMTLVWAQDDPANRREERRQDRREERTRPAENATAATRDTTSDKVSQHVISEFATMLAIKNQEEVELNRWAAEKTQNDDVRQFAQKLIEDHTKMLTALQKFHPVMEFATLESQDTPTSTRTRTTTRRTPTASSPRSPSAPESRPTKAFPPATLANGSSNCRCNSSVTRRRSSCLRA